MAPSRTPAASLAARAEWSSTTPATLPPSGGSSGDEDDGLCSAGPKDDSFDDYEVEEDMESDDSDSAEETPDAAPLRKCSPAPEMKRKAPPEELPDSKRKAAASLAELAMSPKTPATPEDDADKGKAPAREMQLKEKIAAYPPLWKEVEALDAQSSGLLRGAFLWMDDAKARELEEKIKMQRIAELEQFYRRIELKNEVTRELLALLN